MKQIGEEKTMTVREIAEALGTAESTIRNKVSELFPDAVRNGVATLLTEEQVTVIKQNLVPRDLHLKVKLENTMTVKEVANVLGAAEGTIRNKTAELFPEIVKNGKPTFLNEEQVTVIKQNLVPRTLEGKSKVESAVTEIEKDETILKAMQYMKERYENALKRALEAERKNAVLMHVRKTYTAGEIAKELGMRSAQELNAALAEKGVQYKQNGTWLPTADYSDCGYFEIKQQELENGKVIYDRRITQTGREMILNLLRSN